MVQAGGSGSRDSSGFGQGGQRNEIIVDISKKDDDGGIGFRVHGNGLRKKASGGTLFFNFRYDQFNHWRGGHDGCDSALGE